MTGILFVLVILGGSQLVNGGDEKREPISRLAVVGASPNLFGYIIRIKKDFIQNCQENGHNITKELEVVYDNLVQCVNKTPLYVESRGDFIKNLETCSKEPIKKVKSCLRKQQSYYPDILLDLSKAQLNFICNKYEIIRKYLTPCLRAFEKPAIRTSYKQCFIDTLGQTNDTYIIPNSMDRFCQRYVPSLTCFVNVINKECTEYPPLKEFGEDYVKALSQPCAQPSRKNMG